MEKHTHVRDDAVVIPFTPASAKAAPPQKKARTREKESKVAKAEAGAVVSAIDYEALGVPSERVAEMEEARRASLAIGRLETSQVYEFAGIIARVRGWTDDQKQFDAWSKAIFKLGRRGAHNYIMVHEKLGADRDRLVALGLPKASLNELAAAEPEKREEIIRLMESGTELTAAKIKAMASTGEADSETSAADAGGVSGLKARIAEKTAVGAPALMDTAVVILRIILIALEPHRRGRRVEKGTAQKKLVLPARLLRQQLEWLTWVAMPDGKPFEEVEAYVRPLARHDRWYELHQTVEKLGGYESWPDAGEVGAWFTETVVPQLEWLLGKRAEQARTILAVMEKEFEAEKARVAKDKAKARAAAEKTRKKAGKAKTGAASPADAKAVGLAVAAPEITAKVSVPTPKKPRTRGAAAQSTAATEETGTAAPQAEPIALPAQPGAMASPQSEVQQVSDAASPAKAFTPPPFMARRRTKQDGTPPASA